ncbi:MAG: efflux transporter outer membrane subunit, partial [Bauldia sp.]|nr:efflux transporter outer membrane subunit [Bauldia sp.]
LPARTASANAAGGEAQTFQVGANVPDRWWTLFGSNTINRLVDEALTANPNLASAQATLVQAQENYAATRAALLPTLTLPAIQGTASENNPFTVTTQGNLRISYNVEICCGNARNRESQEATLRRQEVSLQASYLTLTANVVNAVINLALLEERLSSTRQVLSLQQQLVEISQQRLNLGDIAATDLASQQAQVVSTQASIVSLQRQVAQQTNQLAIYLGRFPSEMQPIDVDLSDIRLPTDIPVSLPAQLVAQRPDIVQARYSLESANAGVGVAIANMLPSVSLSGSFTPGALAWNFAANVVAATLNSGANLHRTAAARAALEASAHAYENTVITAFVDVANTLQAITYDAQLMALQVQSEAASRRSLDLARQQYELGTAPYSTVLSAEQSYRNAVTSLLSARAQRLTDTVALYVALGGGWWN